MTLDKARVQKELSDLLNELLRSGNQEGSFKVTNVDLENMKFHVAFDIVHIPEDDCLAFQSY